MHPRSLAPRLLLVALAAAATLNANVLMLDFGPTPVHGDALTTSPYHAEDGSFSGTVWNVVQKWDIPVGKVRYADGTLAETVSIDIGGATSNESRTISLAHTPSGSHVLGDAVNTGVYQSASAATDAIFTGQQGGHSRAIGVQINGLPAGTYDVYVVPRNTNSTKQNNLQQVHVGTADAPGDFDYTAPAFARVSLTYANQTSATLRWTEGENYAKKTVTVPAGGVINIAVRGDGEYERRGFLNCVQIVARPPEPPATTPSGD